MCRRSRSPAANMCGWYAGCEHCRALASMSTYRVRTNERDVRGPCGNYSPSIRLCSHGSCGAVKVGACGWAWVPVDMGEASGEHVTNTVSGTGAAALAHAGVCGEPRPTRPVRARRTLSVNVCTAWSLPIPTFRVVCWLATALNLLVSLCRLCHRRGI